MNYDSPTTPSEFGRAALSLAQALNRIQNQPRTQTSDSEEPTEEIQTQVTHQKQHHSLARSLQIHKCGVLEIARLMDTFCSQAASSVSEKQQLFLRLQQSPDFSAGVRGTISAFQRQTEPAALLMQLYQEVLIYSQWQPLCQQYLLCMGPQHPRDFLNEGNFLSYLAFEVFVCFDISDISAQVAEMIQHKLGFQHFEDYAPRSQDDIQLFAEFLVAKLQVEGNQKELVQSVQRFRQANEEQLGMFCSLVIHYQIALGE